MVNFTEACREEWNKRMAICPLFTKRRMSLKSLKFTFSYLWPNVPSLSYKIFCQPQVCAYLQVILHQLSIHTELLPHTAFLKNFLNLTFWVNVKIYLAISSLRFQTVPAASTCVWLLKTIICFNEPFPIYRNSKTSCTFPFKTSTKQQRIYNINGYFPKVPFNTNNVILKPVQLS